MGWLSLLKGLLGLLGKFRAQKRIKVINELRLESFNLHKKRLENKAEDKVNEEIINTRDYLNKP